MPEGPLQVLIVEDSATEAAIFRRYLTSPSAEGQFRVTHVSRLDEALEHLASQPTDIVLLDLMLPDSLELDTLERIVAAAPHLPVIVMTVIDRTETAAQALTIGAQDYLLKHEISGELLRRTVRYAYERKRVERALESERNLLRTIIDSLPDHIYVKDAESRFLLNNRAHLEVLGARSQEEAEGRRDHDFFPLDRAEEYYRDERRVLSTGEPLLDKEERVPHPRKGELHALVSKVPLRDDEGQVVGLVGITKDITPLHRSQQNLEEQLGRIQLLNQIARAIHQRHDLYSTYHVVLQRLETELPADATCLLRWDQAQRRWEPAACGPWCVGDCLMRKMHDERYADLERLLEPCLRRETVVIDDLEGHESGELLSLGEVGARALLVAPLHTDGKVLGVLLVWRRQPGSMDYQTCQFVEHLAAHLALAVEQASLQENLQRAYDSLRRSQRAVMQQERLRALGTMASSIAHDIRNALSPVAAYAELLLLRESNLSDHAREQLEMMAVAAKDVTKIVNRMRVFYRERSADESVKRVDLHAVVAYVVELTKPRWHDLPHSTGHHIDMEVDLADSLPELHGDETEIREALTNLVLNAADAMPEGGKLTVRTRSEGEVVLVEVVDTGIGMDAETRERAIEPFFTTKGERGSGLGLAGVYGVMQRHEGRLEIESEVGAGTTVRLVFPTHRRATSKDEAAEERAASIGRSLRVLVIDDDPMILRLLSDMLEPEGCQVTCAEGGPEGVRTFQLAVEEGAPYDVVITDQGMPHIDGLTVASRIRETAPETGIVLLTGWGDFEERPDVRELVDAFVGKPPSLNDIRVALATAAG